LLLELLAPLPAPNVPTLNAKQIHTDKKYPSPDNIKRLFNRLGIDKVFDKLNAKAKADVKANLQSFNDIRTCPFGDES
jgi:hypothetical protein